MRQAIKYRHAFRSVFHLSWIRTRVVIITVPRKTWGATTAEHSVPSLVFEELTLLDMNWTGT